MTILPKRVGGRPRHAWVKEAILAVLPEIGIGTTGMIRNRVEEVAGKAVGVNTVKRYLRELSDEGRVMRQAYSRRLHVYRIG